MLRKTAAISFVICALLCLGQDSLLRGPVMGYLTEAGTIRAVLGIPGASLMGEALKLPTRLASATVSPKHDYILGIAAEGGNLVLSPMDGTGIRAIENARSNATLIALNVSGDGAAVYFSDTGVIQILAGLPNEARVTYEFEAVGDVSALAVSADLLTVLYASHETGSDALFVRNAAGETHRAGTAGKAAAIAFSLSGLQAAVADSAHSQILLLRDGALQSIAGEREGISTPMAVAFSKRGLLVANAGKPSIASVPLDGSPVKFTACACAPKLLVAWGDGLFQISEAAGGPVFVFDSNTAEGAVWFIPAGERR